MSTISEFISGLVSYKKATKIVFRHHFWIYCLLSILVFGGIFYFGYELQKESWAASVKDAGDNFFLKIWYIVVKAFYYLMSAIMINLTKYVMLMVLSPILAIISERVENILTGNKYALSIPQLIKDVKRAINLALRNLFYEMVLIGLASIVIVIIESIFNIELTWLSWICITLIGAYYYGFSFMDYANERRRLSIKQSIKFISAHKGITIGIGLVFSLIYNDLFRLFDTQYTALAVLAAIIVSVTPIFAVVAATVVVDDLVDLSKNEFAKKGETKVEVYSSSSSDEELEV